MLDYVILELIKAYKKTLNWARQIHCKANVENAALGKALTFLQSSSKTLMVLRNFVLKLTHMDRPEGLGEKGWGVKQALMYENLRAVLFKEGY